MANQPQEQAPQYDHAELERIAILALIKEAQLQHAKKCKSKAMLTFHHHHGSKGKERVAKFYKQCENAKTYQILLASVNNHLLNGGGNTNRSSFKTILAKKLKDHYKEYEGVQRADTRETGKELLKIMPQVLEQLEQNENNAGPQGG